MFNPSRGKRLTGIFLVFFILFNFPFLNAFSEGGMIMGIPVLYFSLFVMWALFILLLAVVLEFPNPKT